MSRLVYISDTPLLRRSVSGDVALIDELHRIEPRIKTVAGEELGVPATFGDTPAIDDADQIRTLDRRQPVRDNQGRASADQRA